MQSTFKDGLKVGFKGKGITPGIPAYVENGGIRTVGGLISNDNENKAFFGTALFVVKGDPSKFFVGTAATTGVNPVTPDQFRGILLNRPMVNQQFPGHADWVLNGSPADAIYQGSVWVEINGDPEVGDDVYANADGTLAATGGTKIDAVVKEKDPDTGLYLIYLDGNF